MAQKRLYEHLNRSSARHYEKLTSSKTIDYHPSSPVTYSPEGAGTLLDFLLALLKLAGLWLALAAPGAVLGYIFLTPYFHYWPRWVPVVLGAAGSIGVLLMLAVIVESIYRFIRDFRRIMSDFLFSLGIFAIKAGLAAVALFGLYYALLYYSRH